MTGKCRFTVRIGIEMLKANALFSRDALTRADSDFVWRLKRRPLWAAPRRFVRHPQGVTLHRNVECSKNLGAPGFPGAGEGVTMPDNVRPSESGESADQITSTVDGD